MDLGAYYMTNDVGMQGVHGLGAMYENAAGLGYASNLRPMRPMHGLGVSPDPTHKGSVIDSGKRYISDEAFANMLPILDQQQAFSVPVFHGVVGSDAATVLAASNVQNEPLPTTIGAWARVEAAKPGTVVFIPASIVDGGDLSRTVYRSGPAAGPEDAIVLPRPAGAPVVPPAPPPPVNLVKPAVAAALTVGTLGLVAVVGIVAYFATRKPKHYSPNRRRHRRR